MWLKYVLCAFTRQTNYEKKKCTYVFFSYFETTFGVENDVM